MGTQTCTTPLSRDVAVRPRPALHRARSIGRRRDGRPVVPTAWLRLLLRAATHLPAGLLGQEVSPLWRRLVTRPTFGMGGTGGDRTIGRRDSPRPRTSDDGKLCGGSQCTVRRQRR